MTSVNQLIKQLIEFYVKENYKVYLSDRNIQIITKNEIPNVVKTIYLEKKDHLKSFLKKTLKEIMKDEYVGDLVVGNICNDIFNDDELCISTITQEIKSYQQMN